MTKCCLFTYAVHRVRCSGVGRLVFIIVFIRLVMRVSWQGVGWGWGGGWVERLSGLYNSQISNQERAKARQQLAPHSEEGARVCESRSKAKNRPHKEERAEGISFCEPRSGRVLTTCSYRLLLFAGSLLFFFFLFFFLPAPSFLPPPRSAETRGRQTPLLTYYVWTKRRAC